MSSILTVLVFLVIAGVILYLLETYVPMAQPIKVIIRVIVVLVICIWLLSLVGVVPPLHLR